VEVAVISGEPEGAEGEKGFDRPLIHSIESAVVTDGGVSLILEFARAQCTRLRAIASTIRNDKERVRKRS
jgi:hypothetical protein